MRLDRITLVLGLALTLAACATEPVEDVTVTSGAADVESVRAEIEQSNDRFAQFYAQDQFDSIAALYTSDAVMMPPNASTVRRDSLAALFGMFKQQGAQAVELTTTDLEVSGDLAVETGRYTLTIAPPGGTQTTEEGKYIVAWKRQPDGAWRIYRDIFNSNTPMAAH